MFNLYEKILKEEYEKTGEILDILQVFFLQVMAGANYQISTDKVMEFIKNKLNVTLSFEELRSVLENIAVVDSIDEDVITLFDPEQVEEIEAEQEAQEEFPEGTPEEGEESEENSEEESELDIDKVDAEEEKATNDMTQDAMSTAISDIKSSTSL